MKKLNIKSFYIFNPELKHQKRKPSEDEQQNAKILYYYPNNEDDIIKRSNTGIIEGTLGFINTFKKEDGNFIYVEMFRNIFIAKKYENNFYLTFILEKSTNNQSSIDYYNHNIETKKNWYKLFLDNFYETLILWHGNLESIFFSTNLFSDINQNINSPNNSNKNVTNLIRIKY